jgi:hypothetical protein
MHFPVVQLLKTRLNIMFPGLRLPIGSFPKRLGAIILHTFVNSEAFKISEVNSGTREDTSVK